MSATSSDLTTFAQRPTGPTGLPLVGHLPWFLADKLGFLRSCAARYGDVVKLRIGEPTYLLTNPADIQHVLIDKALSYSKTRRLTSERGKRLSGSGLQTSFGPEHLRQRRLNQRSWQHLCLWRPHRKRQQRKVAGSSLREPRKRTVSLPI